MPNSLMKHLLRSTLLAALLIAPAAFAADHVSFIADARSGSLMRIEGTSTIHDWHAETKLIGGLLEINPAFPLDDFGKARPGKLDAKAKTLIIVSSFACSSGAAMDKVMREAMKADQHRFIQFELGDLAVKEKTKEGALLLDAKGKLTVAGVTKPLNLAVTLSRTDDKRMTFAGTTKVKMTDFGIQPPAPSLGLGLIKTGDEITLKYEWKVIRRE